MYLIIDRTSTVICATETPEYARKQPNGCIVLTDVSTAEMVYAQETDAFYALHDYRAVEVSDVPTEGVVGWKYDPDTGKTQPPAPTTEERLAAAEAAILALLGVTGDV